MVTEAAPSRTVTEETTLSLAMNPVIRATAICHDPNPRGLKIGAIKPAIRARMLSAFAPSAAR